MPNKRSNSTEGREGANHEHKRHTKQQQHKGRKGREGVNTDHKKPQKATTKGREGANIEDDDGSKASHKVPTTKRMRKWARLLVLDGDGCDGEEKVKGVGRIGSCVEDPLSSRG